MKYLKGWTWPVAAALISLGMLAVAHAYERFGGYLPCPLCLRQREVYWAVIAMSLTGLTIWKFVPKRRFLVTLNLLIGLTFIVSLIVAAYHTGVEWKIFPPPATCASGSAVDLSQPITFDPVKVPACDEVALYILGLSMATWNVLASAVFATLSFMAAVASFPKWKSDVPEN